MHRIDVYVLLVNDGYTDHVEIHLDEASKFYRLNIWENAISRASESDYALRHAIAAANKYAEQLNEKKIKKDTVITFSINGDLEKIIAAWKEYKMKPADIRTNNCADATYWFLETFANIPRAALKDNTPEGKNVVAFGVKVSNSFYNKLPTFFAPPSLPGILMDQLKQYLDALFAQPRFAIQNDHNIVNNDINNNNNVNDDNVIEQSISLKK